MAALKRITDAEFTGWKPTVAPYEPAKNPAPTVSSILPNRRLLSIRVSFLFAIRSFIPLGSYSFDIFFRTQLYTKQRGTLPPKVPRPEARVADVVRSAEEENEAADVEAAMGQSVPPQPRPAASEPKTRG